ncbi:calcium-binding and coiled-coil domain-containing protein 2 [Spea bombifrons]|uniref:calcium-binding and coiled-coil domain-containing protein 2 n=1 Tax=Spea bombifrons TaxID=233779 RepID=UPI0023495678|nr:calcium-binding and coiled-coil domain-containing protein 2 [Spea bombifrons]
MGDPPTSIVPPDEENFSNVIFNRVEKSYKANTDILCSFIYSQNFQPKKKDWIGIFKVGWKTTREYFTWTSAASDQEGLERRIFFKAYYLPKESENYYQFCYVDGKGEVRGASTPFLFTNENKEEDCEILMVMTEEEQKMNTQRILELQEEQQRSAKQISELKESLAQVQIEKDSLNNMVSSLEKEKLSQTSQIEDFEAKLETCMDNREKLELEKKEIQIQLNLERNKKDDETKQLEKMKTQHKLDHEEWEKNIQRLQAELKQVELSFDTSLRENENMKLENEAQQKKMAALNVDMALKEILISELKDQSQDLKKFRKEVETLQDTLKDQRAKELETTKKMASDKEKQSILEKDLDQQKLLSATFEKEMETLVLTVAEREADIRKLHELNQEQLNKIEKEKERFKEELEKRNASAEEKEQEMRNRLKSNEQNTLTLQRQLDERKKEMEMMSIELNDLHCTVHLREVEISELKDERKRTHEEMDHLNQVLNQRSMGTFSSCLSYRNPYQEEGLWPLVGGQERQPDLECPICKEKFLGSQEQLLYDHMLCHEIEQHD